MSPELQSALITEFGIPVFAYSIGYCLGRYTEQSKDPAMYLAPLFSILLATAGVWSNEPNLTFTSLMFTAAFPTGYIRAFTQKNRYHSVSFDQTEIVPQQPSPNGASAHQVRVLSQ